MVDAERSAEISKHKVQGVMGTGARAVVTSCQQCVRTMTTHVRRNKVDLQALAKPQLVQKALKPETNIMDVPK
jgi:heterodisulfide reductase subunit D